MVDVLRVLAFDVATVSSNGDRTTQKMAATRTGVLSPATASISSPANFFGRPVNLWFSPLSFRPLSVSKQNHSSALPRLRIAHVAVIVPKRTNRSFAVSGSLSGDSGSNPEEEPKDSNEVASVDIKLPRRSLLVQFTCNSCGEKTKRLINRLAYERGLVFVQCAGCLRHHKLVDNLGLIVEYDFRETSKGSSIDQV